MKQKKRQKKQLKKLVNIMTVNVIIGILTLLEETMDKYLFQNQGNCWA